MLNKKAVSLTLLALGLSATTQVHAVLDNGAYFTPKGDKVVFHSYRDKAGELWIMNRDGSSPKKITSGDNHDRWPAISADGKKIAFVSRRNGNWDVYSVNIDGSHLTQITHTEEDELGASFSPDGKQIVYSRAKRGETPVIFVADAEGKNEHKITEGGTWPLWNAKNNQILYGKWGEDSRGIYVYDVNHKKEIKLVDGKNKPASSAWSPDGKSIYFVQEQHGQQEIFRMKSDGSHIEALNLKAQGDSRPVISPDGHLLLWGHNRHGGADIFAFHFGHDKEINLTPNSKYERFPDVNLKTRSVVVSSKRDGNGEIYRIDHHKKPINLTNSAHNDMGARWSPSGRLVSFSSNPLGAHNVYVMDANGGHKRQITENETDTFASGWSNDEKLIVTTHGRWGEQDVEVFNIETGKVTFKLDSDFAEFDPAFGPHSKSLVYVKGKNNNFGIYQINLETRKEVELVKAEGWNFAPNFSPDGSKLAFSSNRDGDLEIYVLDLKSKKIEQLTDNYREDNFPRWTADSKALIFDSDRYGNFEAFIVELKDKKRHRIDVGR